MYKNEKTLAGEEKADIINEKDIVFIVKMTKLRFSAKKCEKTVDRNEKYGYDKGYIVGKP